MRFDFAVTEINFNMKSLWLFLTLVAVVTALYDSSDDVKILTPSNFNQQVIQSDGLWLVEFFAPWCGHCKSLAPEWKKAAKALKGIVNVAAVDASEHQSLGGQYGVQGFPTIKIFGLNKAKPEDYNGARSASAIVDTAISKLKELVNQRLSGKSSGSGGSSSGGDSGRKSGDAKDVVELTDSNFEELVLKSNDIWLVEFFAPWCGHCKNLAPHWAEAATELKGKVKLGAVDATVHTVVAGRFGIRGYPTIKYFPAGKKDPEGEEYTGGRTASDIISWANEKLAENVPAPEIVELTDNSVLQAACENPLCIISVLPVIYDCQSQCRNKYIEIMRTMAEKYKKNRWGWVWAEAAVQPQLEQAFGIGGFGYPAMAALNSRKMKFSLLRGPFSETGINEFLRELSVGRGSTSPLQGSALPSISKTEPWDGKDKELVIEDDIDLSDVDLDEKTEL